MSHKAALKIIALLFIFFGAQYFLMYYLPSGSGLTYSFLYYFNILAASVAYYSVTQDVTVGLIFSFFIVSQLFIVQKITAESPVLGYISLGILILLDAAAFLEKTKMNSLKRHFRSDFLNIKNEVTQKNDALGIESSRVTELEMEIKDTEALYVFSKMLENVITKEDLNTVLEEGFSKIGLNAGFVIFMLVGGKYSFLASNIKSKISLDSIIDDNMWLSQSDFVEISGPGPQWERYWKKVFPDAETLFINPMRVGGEKIGLILFAVRENAADRSKVISVSNEITLGMKKVLLYEKVKELSRTDGLTGLHIRRYFFEKFDEELRRARRYKTPVAVLMSDIDHFKKVNDTYGHQAGDAVLQAVARIVVSGISAVDFCGRYGGEEFCTVLVNHTRAEAAAVAEGIRKKVCIAEVDWEGQKIQASLSFGISCFPEDGLEAQELVRKADEALFKAKESGRNRVCVFGE